MNHYFTAQICKNGDCIVASIEEWPEQCADYCPKCGAKTISACPSCNADIRGFYSEDGVASYRPYSVPAYCHHCGQPYPWTQSAIEAASELIQEEIMLDRDLREKLISSLPDIVSETPKTNLAIVRFKRFLASAGKFTADALRQFVIDFGCELAKDQLGL